MTPKSHKDVETEMPEDIAKWQAEQEIIGDALAVLSRLELTSQENDETWITAKSQMALVLYFKKLRQMQEDLEISVREMKKDIDSSEIFYKGLESTLEKKNEEIQTLQRELDEAKDCNEGAMFNMKKFERKEEELIRIKKLLAFYLGSEE